MLLIIVFWLFVALAVFLVGCLATPVKLRLHGQSTTHLNLRVEARPFGGISPSLTVFDSAREPSKKKAEKKAKKAKDKKERRQIFKVRNMILAAPELVTGILYAIHFDHLRLDGEFGLADPADTGQLYGHLTPLMYGMTGSSHVSVALRPDFHKANLSGELDTVFSITPTELLAPVIQFAWRAIFGMGK